MKIRNFINRLWVKIAGKLLLTYLWFEFCKGFPSCHPSRDKFPNGSSEWFYQNKYDVEYRYRQNNHQNQ